MVISDSEKMKYASLTKPFIGSSESADTDVKKPWNFSFFLPEKPWNWKYFVIKH